MCVFGRCRMPDEGAREWEIKPKILITFTFDFCILRCSPRARWATANRRKILQVKKVPLMAGKIAFRRFIVESSFSHFHFYSLRLFSCRWFAPCAVSLCELKYSSWCKNVVFTTSVEEFPSFGLSKKKTRRNRKKHFIFGWNRNGSNRLDPLDSIQKATNALSRKTEMIMAKMNTVECNSIFFDGVRRKRWQEMKQ